MEGRLKEITISSDTPIGRDAYFLRALKVVRLNAHSFLKFRKMWSRSVVKFLSLKSRIQMVVRSSKGQLGFTHPSCVLIRMCHLYADNSFGDGEEEETTHFSS